MWIVVVKRVGWSVFHVELSRFVSVHIADSLLSRAKIFNDLFYVACAGLILIRGNRTSVFPS